MLAKTPMGYRQAYLELLVDEMEEDALDDMKRPFDGFLDNTLRNGRHTPDMPKIMKVNHHLLFTYGTLRKGQARHSLLHGCEYIGNAVSTIVSYQLFRHKDGGFPVAIMGGIPSSKEPKAAVYGEVYLVPNYLIPVLDQVEANGKLYHRMTSYVTMTSKRYKKRPILPCLTYNGIKRAWEDVIETDCDPCPIIKPRDATIPNFYEFIG